MAARSFKALALASMLLAAPAAAQQGVPYFPQTLQSGTVVGRLSSGSGPTEAISMAALIAALFPGGPAASSFSVSSLNYSGSVSGTVTIKAQAAAGTYTIQLPSIVGVSNNCLSETVSGSVATTAWSACAYLGSNNAFSGNNTHAGTETFNAASTFNANANFTSTFQIGGTTQTYPASGQIVGTTDTQTLTNKSISGAEINSGTIAAARGGAGTINGVLSANGSGTVTQGATTGLSDVTIGGTVTPTDNSGASLTFTSVSAKYDKIGDVVHVFAQLSYPSTANGSASSISLTGAPAFPSANYGRQCTLTYANSSSTAAFILATVSSTTIQFADATGAAVTNATLSTKTLIFNCIYPAT